MVVPYFGMLNSIATILYILPFFVARAENVFPVRNIGIAYPGSESIKLAKRRDLDPQTCVDNFDIHRDKIIRTEDSREMGAKYLNEIDLGSRDECLRLCCETESCDVFVFEEKSPGSCYLFHCGPPEDFKCKFTRHTNFSSAVLAVNRHLAELEDQIKLTKHEQDLASLRKQIQDGPTSKPAVTMHPVIKHLEPVTSTPTRRCSRFQFECHSSEECIAIYNACDGIPQCADGSDEAPELGCPATTTPLPNPPPREVLPQIPQAQHLPQNPMYSGGDAGSKESLGVQHAPAFMRPISSSEGQPWPRRLDQSSQSVQNSHNMKQYNDNVENSRIFNHKGGLQVTETDSAAAGQFDYKGLPYDALNENNWAHRTWPQQQQDQMNINDGSPMYHMDIDSQNGWKQPQAPVQNIPIPRIIRPAENQMVNQRIQTEKITIQNMPNIFQDREKMWAVPQIQENQPTYTEPKLMPPPDMTFSKPKSDVDKKQPSYSTVKSSSETDTDNDEKVDEEEDEVSNENKDKNDDSKKTSRHKESNNKKHSANKTKKKHLKSEPKEDDERDEKNMDSPMNEHMIMGKQFNDDSHDGAAEKPPGAILLLTLGVCMTSIMAVLLGCRLKMARRRMRRNGKSPFAHDADYLVNGMYL